MNRYAFYAILFIVCLGVGCGSTSVGYNSHCKDNSDCSQGQVCSNNQCIDYLSDASDGDLELTFEEDETLNEDAEKSDEIIIELEEKTDAEENIELPELSDEADSDLEESTEIGDETTEKEEEQCDCSPYFGRYCVQKKSGDCINRSPEILITSTEGAQCSTDVAYTDGTSSQSVSTGYCGLPTDFYDCKLSDNGNSPFTITLDCGPQEKKCIVQLTVSACGADGDEEEKEEEAEEEDVCEAVNQCGVCGPDLPLFGSDCVVSEQCLGTYICASDGMSLECKPKNANACGLCEGPEIMGLGDACGECGKNVCNSAGDGVVCEDPGKNECGVCGPSLPQKGGSCLGENSCEGSLICADTGLKLVCQYPERNNCGLCGGQTVTGLGDACGDCGKYACNNDGDGAICADPGKNECGVCGAKLPEKGASCGVCGVYICSNDGLSLACDDPGKNVCGVCGPQLTGKGDVCGECGVKVCAQDGQSLICGGSDIARCDKPNASAYECKDGFCQVTACKQGYMDADNSSLNGCECRYFGATDVPGDYVDANCDGIDGDIKFAVFVSKAGSDSNAGTMDAPVLTFKKAIEVAAGSTPVKYVIAGLGAWNEKVQLYAGVSMFGGYDDAKMPWVAGNANKTIVSDDGYALTAEGISVATTVQGFEFRGKASQNQNGKSATAIYLKTCSSSLLFKNCLIVAGDGNAGFDGQKGSDGDTGGAGTTPAEGMNQFGKGGTSTCGVPGANGGVGGCGWNDGQPGGGPCGGAGGNSRHVQGYAPGCAAKGGQSGSPGAGGKAKISINPAGEIISQGGMNGSSGGAGEGGSGGGGGRGANEWFDDKCAGGGGGGGAGGCGGGAAIGGGAGGSSFAVVISGGLGNFENCVITAGSGGKGGDGKPGGKGGAGGAAGGGGDQEGTLAGDGAPGAVGGKGGEGGSSGGGAGGSSSAFLLLDATVDKVLLKDCQISRGNLGAGGRGGADINAGEQGLSQDYIIVTP